MFDAVVSVGHWDRIVSALGHPSRADSSQHLAGLRFTARGEMAPGSAQCRLSHTYRHCTNRWGEIRDAQPSETALSARPCCLIMRQAAS